MKRAIQILGQDTELELGTVVQIKLGPKGKRFVYLEEMQNGKWRLAYTDNLIEDIQKVSGFIIVRED